MNLTTLSLKQISLYTINKETKDQNFEADLDDNKITDETLGNFTVKVAKENYVKKELRELVFTEASTVRLIISNIIKRKDDENLFKVQTRNIAEKLFIVTQINWKKGDLLSALFEQTENFCFILLKVDENNYIKKGADGLWVEDVGFNKEIKLQKAIYITIPKKDNSFEEDCSLWTIHSIDKVSDDSQYWNNKFIEANFKRDNVTNTREVKHFFDSFLKTISQPEEKFRINYQFVNYAKNTTNFTVKGVAQAIYGDSDENKEIRDRFKNELVESARQNNYDLAFKIDKNSFKGGFKPGKFIIDNRIKISYTREVDAPNVQEARLKNQIKIEDGDGVPFVDQDGQKFAKVYYEEIVFKQ